MNDHGTQNFIRAVGYLDEKWLLEHREYEKKLRRRARTLRTVAASCACLVLCVAILLPVLHGLRPDDGIVDPPPADSTPPDDDTNNDCIIGPMPSYHFDIFQQAADAPLPEGNLPQEGDLLPWYVEYMSSNNPDSTPMNENEARASMNHITEKLSDALRISIPSYTFTINEEGYLSTRLTTAITTPSGQITDKDWFSFFHSNGVEGCNFFMPDYYRDIEIDGQVVEIDPTSSDEEIAASLQEVRLRLCDVFGIALPDIRINRQSNGITAPKIYIYLYDQAAHPLGEEEIINEPGPLSNYIRLCFENTAQDHPDDQYTDNFHMVSVAHYRSRLISQGLYYSPMEELPVLSLDEASSLLASLCRCMACSKEFDVSDYDAIGFAYVRSRYYPYTMEERYNWGIIPCYAFYKAIDPPLYYECKPGNQMYCVTYIPAIAFEGMHEYFEAQAKSHNFLPPETDPAE